MSDGAHRDPGARPSPAEPGRRGGARLADPVRFDERGYGSTCSVCGSLVVGTDGRTAHRRHHQALAAIEREIG